MVKDVRRECEDTADSGPDSVAAGGSSRDVKHIVLPQVRYPHYGFNQIEEEAIMTD